MTKLHQIKQLYHFTDRRNISLIRELGGLYSLAFLKLFGIEIPAPGGNDWSQQEDCRLGMDKYVHLCFRNNHPMEHIAKNDGRIQSSIFLNINPIVLQKPGVLFTEEVANKSGCTRYTIEQAEKIIDFEVLYQRTDWNDSSIQSRLKKVEKYEILVPDTIPMKLIRNISNG